MKVVFFGSSKYVIPIIEVLKRDFDLVLVVTTERNSSDPIPSYCLSQKIPYLSVSNLSNYTMNHELLTINPLVGVLADFGLIIPKEILSSFPKGIINIHPSLLPKYRGPTPVQQAILNGDKKTGVTIIKLDNEVDHGPILAQEKVLISPSDTAQILYEKLFKIGAELLHQNLNKYIKGELKLSEQDHSKATFTKLLTREDGFFDIDNPPSKDILDRMIRAYYPWPGVWTNVQISTPNKQQLTTNKKLEVISQKLEVRIKFLPGNLIQVEGKKPMSYKDFLNGYPETKELLKHI
ncbi:MAG: methionyl-tRNA formyltransferase [Patescibacteria group bacterium]